MKETILHNWNFMRVLRLIIGIALLMQGIMRHDGLMAILGAVFSLMPILNIGCCGTNGCAISPKKTDNKTEETDYEEIR